MDLKRFSKSTVCLVIYWITAHAVADVNDVRLEMRDHRALKGFTLIDEHNGSDENIESLEHALVRMFQFNDKQNQYARYQQYYRGIPVLGRNVIAHFGRDKDRSLYDAEFSGKLGRGIRLKIADARRTDDYREEILRMAREDFAERIGVNGNVYDRDSQPVIWIDSDQTPHFSYQVSFRIRPVDGPEMWPHYLIDAQDSRIYQYWDNIRSLYQDKGPGGNAMTGPYTYGENEMPSLSVTKNNDVCLLANTRLRVFSLGNRNYWMDSDFDEPFQYVCGNNRGDFANGAYSPSNDAYVFGNMVVAMYERWYGQDILADRQPVMVATHAGTDYENAVWNGTNVLLGDGGEHFYPFVSLGVLAHEMSHAFTQQYSGLTGPGESGAINEAFSDMAAVAAVYYLRQHDEKVHARLYGNQQISWQFGDRISKKREPIRSLSQPARYGAADCYRPVAGCDREFDDVDSEDIVHLGSGVFSKAFYELTRSLNGDVRKAFGLMLKANMIHWTADSGFEDAACGVKLTARQEGVSETIVSAAFESVGVTPAC